MPKPLRWSHCNLMLAELREGPQLASALRRYGDVVYAMANLNRELRKAGSPLRVRSRPVHVPTRFGRLPDRLYMLERVQP